jgi:hypothetical protein
MNSFVLVALLASPMVFIKADDTAAIAAGLGLECSPPADSDFSELAFKLRGDSDDKTVEGCYAYAKNLLQ